MKSREMENFRFSVFYNQSKLINQERNDVLTTEEKSVRFFKRFFCDTKSILLIKKRKEIEMLRFFDIFFKNMENW